MKNRERKALQQRQLEESEAVQNGSNRGTTQDHSDTQAGFNPGLGPGYMALGAGPRPGAIYGPGLITNLRMPPPFLMGLDSMQRAAALSGEVVMEPESEFPSEIQLEPIRVWRALDIRVEGNNVALGAMNTSFGKFLAVEHEAECKDSSGGSWHIPVIYGRPVIQLPTHVVPELHCKCGFYGVKEKEDCLDGTIFIAEAEFYGKVIEHDTGYRAQFQRVLAVRVERPKLCLGAFLCDGEPEVLWFTEASQSTSAWGGKPPAPAVICQACALEIAGHGGKVATLPKLAARLGVEVRWDA